MKNFAFITLILIFLVACDHTPLPITDTIKLNSLGFLPDAPKQASVTSQAQAFVLRNAENNKQVYKGNIGSSVSQEDVAQEVWTADFSSFRKPGKYYLEIPGVGRSIDFSIGNQVYNDAWYTATRAFYLWRCGMEVSGEHNGDYFHQAACHLNDGFEDYIGNKGAWRDGTGGWHDAGDYGKYVVNAGITAGVLFMAWEQFKPQLEKAKLDLPETAPGFPEFLKELKWETDWLLKMPYTDGSGRVSHKLTRVNFSGFIMADKDEEKRYFTEWSSAATASFVAMMAQAARIFEPYDSEYAQKCLDAARSSYKFLKENPEDKRFEQGDFKTGGYQTRDPDDRLWASAEMWETTGKLNFSQISKNVLPN